MKRVKNLVNESLDIEANRIERIANEAVMKAKEENKKHGFPDFFYKNGKIYYVLEDGNITTEKPDIFK